MTPFDHSVAANDAMLVGFLNLVDFGTPNAYAVIYSGSRPATPGDVTGEAALATIIFAKPAAALINHALVFSQAEAGGDMVTTQGSATWARFFNGAGTWLADVDVTDMAGAGPLKVSGTTGTLLYAGARVLLGSLLMA